MFKSLIYATVVALVSTTAMAQDPIKRTLLQRFDVPGTNYETVTGIAEIVPNVSIGRHTHPGLEAGYVLEGSLELLIEGAQPLQLKAGDSFKVVPAGVIHDAKTGPNGAKIIGAYTVEKGKPLASPAQ